MLDEHEDTPDFTRQNPQRQRRSLAQGRCQVCDQGLPWSKRWLVVSDVSVTFRDVRDPTGRVRHLPTITEPWLCHRCAVFAVSTCPALIRRHREDRLITLPITSPGQVALVATDAHLDHEPTTQPGHPDFISPAVLWLSLVLVDPALTDLIIEAPAESAPAQPDPQEPRP